MGARLIRPEALWAVAACQLGREGLTPKQLSRSHHGENDISNRGCLRRAFLTQPASSQPEQKLGKVNFETSCKPEAQKHFNRAMLYQHSFWYRASQQAFEEALKADPECGIAYWGIALSLLWNPHVPPPAKNLAEGAAAIAKGKERRRQDAARARLHRRARRHVCRPRQGRPPHAHRGLCEGDGAVGAALSEGRRGADPLRARAQHVGVAGRQDLRQPAQGRGDPGADLRSASRSIRAWRII